MDISTLKCMSRPTKREQTNKKISEAVSKMTPDVVNKLKEVFAIDGTIEEACFYAGISRQTYYGWIKKNKELFDEFQALRERPVLKARQTVVKSLDNPDYAFKYLERKKKDEFSPRSELTGKDGKDLVPENKEGIINAIDEYLNDNKGNTK